MFYVNLRILIETRYFLECVYCSLVNCCKVKFIIEALVNRKSRELYLVIRAKFALGEKFCTLQ
jgi:hypothetical protein